MKVTHSKNFNFILVCGFMPCDTAKKGGGGVRKTEVNMEFKSRRMYGCLKRNKENGEVGIFKHRAREGKILKVLTKKILPLYSSISAAFLSFLCVGTCKSLSST